VRAPAAVTSQFLGVIIRSSFSLACGAARNRRGCTDPTPVDPGMVNGGTRVDWRSSVADRRRGGHYQAALKLPGAPTVMR
jgi:hypothetical protein